MYRESIRTQAGLEVAVCCLLDPAWQMNSVAAFYVDRILRGAKPAELPVQFPIKFETVLNLTTAKGLGLMVPQSILLRADDVIE
jgi:ABC-type uncharacterized transport system substrate-binding protein